MVEYRTPRLIVVRHFPVDDRSICYGQSDPACTVTRAQLKELQLCLERELGSDPFALFSSPAQRCRIIADHLATAWGVPLTVDPLLWELSMGEFEGQRYQDLESDERFIHWMDHWKSSPPPGGETVDQLVVRVGRFLASLDPPSSSLVIAHAGVVRALKVLISGLCWEETFAESVPHARPLLFTEFSRWSGR